MKKIAFIICAITLITMLIACSKKTEDGQKTIIQHMTTTVRENDSGENVMEIINYVKNDKHFDFIKNVKVFENEDYNNILNMGEGEYFSTVDKAANIIYPLGKIYLFHLRDINQMGSVMMKAINLKGSTLSDAKRNHKERYLVATHGNYLIVGIGDDQDCNEVKDIIDIFEKYFGKDNLDNIYNLLLEVKK